MTSPDALRRPRRRTARRAVAVAAIAAALASAACTKDEQANPGSTTTTTADVSARMGEIRSFMNEALMTAEAKDLVGMASGPARRFAEFQANLESIGDFQEKEEIDPPPERVDVDGLTGARRDGARIIVEGETVSYGVDGEETKLSDIVLVEEGDAFKLDDFRFGATGLKASQMVVDGGDDATDPDVAVRVLGAACYPPGSVGDDPVLQVQIEYEANGAKPVRLTGGEVKPAATPKITSRQGWSDTARPDLPAKGALLFEGSAFDGATATLAFEDEDGEDLPNVVVSTPTFPDARACRTEVEGGSRATTTSRRSTGTTRSGTGTTRSGTGTTRRTPGTSRSTTTTTEG